ncbi:MAG TPA: CDP-alcohol phosphatidyltransferase family protein [Tepidisphaeraceae bacterium]|jgi:phosphatidylglycerophosphate synthase
MAENAYHVTDRRPIAARRFAIFQHMAASLARAHVTANTISVAGMISGILAGISLYFTASTGPLTSRILWLAAAGLVQLRLLANMLDGMVAIASATASKVGELFNEMPDRISDAATLIGLGYAVGGQPTLGWSAALLAVFTAYVRSMGKAAGAGSDFRGPMAKQQRMFLVTLTGVFCAFAPAQLLRYPATICLWLICAGCIVTIWRRLSGIASNLRSAA